MVHRYYIADYDITVRTPSYSTAQRWHRHWSIYDSYNDAYVACGRRAQEYSPGRMRVFKIMTLEE